MQTYRTTHDEVRPFRGAASEHEPAEIEFDLMPEAIHYLAADDKGPCACLTAIPSQWLAFDAWCIYGVAHTDQKGVAALIERVTADACGSDGPYHLWCAVPDSMMDVFDDAGWQPAPGASVGQTVDRTIMVHNCRPTHLRI